MCKQLFITIFLLSVWSLTSPALANANIQTLEDDVTNDGFKDTLQLHGTYLSDQSTFFKDVSLSIHNNFEKKWHIILKEGYDPTITIKNITNDNKMNILYAVALNNERTIHHYDMYEFDGRAFIKIPLPTIEHIEGEFVDQFQVAIKNKFNQQQWRFHLNEQKKAYVEGKLYKNDGTLNKKQKLQLSPIYEATPILLSASKGYGLQTKRYIVGISEQDIIATIETVFYYKKGKWTIVTENITSI